MSRDLDNLPVLPHETGQFLITPYFQHLSVYDRAKSQDQGKAVYELMEVVQLRLAGDRNYSPVFPADAMSYRDEDNRVVTYAERWSKQYRAFMSGDDQKAGGTALEMLVDFGVTPAQISICRALNVHSIEALNELPQEKVKNLGLNGNALKSMAKRWADSQRNRDADDIASLKARLAALEAKQVLPPEPAGPDVVDALVAAADDEFTVMTDREIRDHIKAKTGHGVVGQPSRATLVSMAREV